jgi:VanZ family protein
LGITYLSLSPSPEVTAGNDKVGHLIAYSVLMMHVGWLFPRNKLWFAAVLSFFYGAFMEFGQYFVPGRFVSSLDLLANTIGVVIGWGIVLFTYNWMRRRLGF